jgi:predicted nucleotidyltransferase
MTTTTQNQQILNYLKPYQLEWVGIFGSWARGENGPQSDLDMLIKFTKPISLLTFVRIERELSELLGLKVDLVSDGGLKNERMRKRVLNDLKLIQA